MSDELARELLTTMERLKKIHTYRISGSPMQKSEYFILSSIVRTEAVEGQGVLASQLSGLHNISKPAISQSVAALEKKGLVTRRMDSRDRRKIWICLTEKGNRSIDEMNKRFTQFTEELVKRLGEKDTNLLIRLFNRLFEILEDMGREKLLTKETPAETKKGSAL